MSVSHRTSCAWLSLLALTACKVGPDFKPPDVVAPMQWLSQTHDVEGRTYGGPVDVAWWKHFHDPELNALIDRLAVQNLDLKAGMQRILQARSQTRIAASIGLPSLGWEGSYTRTRQSANGFISLVEPAPGATLDYNFYANTLGASWDLDLFGQVRRATEAQRASQEAAIEARRGVALSTLSTLVKTYMELRGVQDQMRITREALDVATKNLSLVNDRFAHGVATTLDTAQARMQQEMFASTLPPLTNAESALINAIGLLLAEPPRSLSEELRRNPGALPIVVPKAPIGLPSGLARRRPDIREAEARLHAATANVGVASAAFYPDITLTGNIGTTSLSASDFFSLPARQAAVGPTLSIPLFQGGRLSGTLALRKAEHKAAAIAFNQPVINA